MSLRVTCATVLAATALSGRAYGQAHRERPRMLLAARMAEGAVEMASGRLDRWSAMAIEAWGEDTPAEPEAPPTDDSPPANDRVTQGDDAMIAGWTGATWSSCGIDGAAEAIDLRAGNLLAVQVSVASRGARSVAMVTLGRPGAGRHGMTFPESRWVEWEGDRPARITNTPGFEPDAQLALGDDEDSVLSYVANEDDAEAEAVALTGIGSGGRVTHATRVIDGTAGMAMDSPLVAWRGGVATVLDRPTAGGNPRPGSASLYMLRRDGARAAPPRPLTDDERDDGVGGWRTGLAAEDNGTVLTAAWAVPSGPRAGVWVRRGITLTTLPSPARRSDRQGLFAAEPGAGGVVFRRRAAGDDGALTEVSFVPFGQGATARLLGTFWDPTVAWSTHGPLVVGQRPATPMPSAVVVFPTRSGDHVATVRDPHQVLAPLAEAVDVAVAPTPSGAVVAWIEPGTSDDARRRLALARVACVAPPASVPAPVTLGAGTPDTTWSSQSSRDWDADEGVSVTNPR